MSDLKISDLSVLLIEPSGVQSRIIEQSLQETGITNIEIVHCGEDAITIMENYIPDLVISSMYFPDITGTDLILTMRQNPLWEPIPFMLISSETQSHNLEIIKQIGVVAILPKPFSSRDLKRALQATIVYLEPEEMMHDDINMAELFVLLVDDSKMARRHIRRVMENIGIRKFVEAEDGTEAVKVMVDNNFDLIVSDYNMPEMDGRELIEYIRNKSNQVYVPVLMVTSETNNTTLNGIRQAGVSAICDKPFDANSVKAILQNILSL